MSEDKEQLEQIRCKTDELNQRLELIQIAKAELSRMEIIRDGLSADSDSEERQFAVEEIERSRTEIRQFIVKSQGYAAELVRVRSALLSRWRLGFDLNSAIEMVA